MKRLVASIFVVGVTVAPLLAHLAPAGAAWTASGAGTATGAATVMPAGAAPTAALSGTTATVTWTAATFPNGTPVAGYTVQRINAINGAPATVGGTCSGVVTTTSCSESVPSGSWVYTDTPVQLTWTGSVSPASNTITVP